MTRSRDREFREPGHAGELFRTQTSTAFAGGIIGYGAVKQQCNGFEHHAGGSLRFHGAASG